MPNIGGRDPYEDYGNWNAKAPKMGPSASMMPGVGAGLGAVGGGLGAWAESQGQKRQMENQFESNLATQRNENPNAQLNAAVSRNMKGALRDNLSAMVNAPGGIAGMSGMDFQGGLADAYLRSIQGVNPMLQQEAANIAGVPGLNVGGQQISEFERPELKGAGLGETMAGVLGGLFGG